MAPGPSIFGCAFRHLHVVAGLFFVALALSGCAATPSGGVSAEPSPSQISRCNFRSEVVLEDGNFRILDENFAAAAVRQMWAVGSNGVGIGMSRLPVDTADDVLRILAMLRGQLQQLGLQSDQVRTTPFNPAVGERAVEVSVCGLGRLSRENIGPEDPDMLTPILVAGQRFAIPMRFLDWPYWNNIPIGYRYDRSEVTLVLRWPDLAAVLPPRPPRCEAPEANVDGCVHVLRADIIRTRIPADALHPRRVDPPPGYGAQEMRRGTTRIVCTWRLFANQSPVAGSTPREIPGTRVCSAKDPSMGLAGLRIHIPATLTAESWDIVKIVTDFVRNFVVPPVAARSENR